MTRWPTDLRDVESCCTHVPLRRSHTGGDRRPHLIGAQAEDDMTRSRCRLDSHGPNVIGLPSIRTEQAEAAFMQPDLHALPART